jgi:non-ribosomal peptide synthetase component F
VQLGVSRDVGVGLMMDRSFELVIAMLAAMKVGRCWPITGCVCFAMKLCMQGIPYAHFLHTLHSTVA